jgi:hypothetical protein
MVRLISFVSFGIVSLAGLAVAQEFPRRYDGIQAGVDAYQLAEERRQANLRAQIGANDAARAAAGLPTTRGETIYYYGGYSPYGVVPWDAAYAYGGSYGYATTGLFGRRVVSFSAGPVFTPWPYVPGDIYGYRTYPQVRQPIGQRQVQIDENTWESHPVYDPPIPHHPVLPPVDSPLLRNTPFAREPAQPEVEVLPEPAPRSSTARDF